MPDRPALPPGAALPAALPAALLAALAACAHGRGAAPGAEVVVSLRDIDCASCGDAVVRALSRREGVAEAAFDRDRAEVTVRFDPARLREADVVGAVRELGYQAEVGAGKGAYLPDAEFPAGADVEWISRGGRDVDIDAAVVAGKVTVVDFYARWCGPCREVDRAMQEVLARTDIALRKVDVADWDSPVARRYLATVPELPYVIVYGKDGRRIDAIAGLDLARLRRAIDAGAR